LPREAGKIYRFPTDISKARLNQYTQVFYLTDENDEVTAVSPIPVIISPTPEEIEGIENRTVIMGYIAEYQPTRDGGLKGIIHPVGPDFTFKKHVFLGKNLCKAIAKKDFPAKTRIVFATAIPTEGFGVEYELAVVVNIEKDPDDLIEDMEDLLPATAATALHYSPEIAIDLFIGEELGASSSTPYMDFPASSYYDLPQDPTETIGFIVGKARRLFVRNGCNAKERLLRVGQLNILVNPYNYSPRPQSYWIAAIIAYYVAKKSIAARIFLLRKLDYESTFWNLKAINDLSMYYNTRTQHSQVLAIHFSQVDMQFCQFDKDTKKVTNGRSETHHKICLIEFTRAHLPRNGPVCFLELKEDPLEYKVESSVNLVEMGAQDDDAVSSPDIYD
jgi:hypothetical protein